MKHCKNSDGHAGKSSKKVSPISTSKFKEGFPYIIITYRSSKMPNTSHKHKKEEINENDDGRSQRNLPLWSLNCVLTEESHTNEESRKINTKTIKHINSKPCHERKKLMSQGIVLILLKPFQWLSKNSQTSVLQPLHKTLSR